MLEDIISKCNKCKKLIDPVLPMHKPSCHTVQMIVVWPCDNLMHGLTAILAHRLCLKPKIFLFFILERVIRG